MEPDKTDVAKAALEKAKARDVQFLLPTDNIVATPVKTDKLNKKGKPVIELTNPRVNSGPEYSRRRGRRGHRARDGQGLFGEVVRRRKRFCGTGRWAFSKTRVLPTAPLPWRSAVVDATQKNGAKSIIGGGDSVKALNKAEARRQGDLHEHRRRREPGISGRQGAARRGGAGGQQLRRPNHL